MIRINLLHDTSRPERTARSSWVTHVLPPALSFLVVSLTAGRCWELGEARADVLRKIATDETRLHAAKEDSRRLDEATARRTALRAQLDAIAHAHQEWRRAANSLEALSQCLPEGMWFTDVKKTGLVIDVEGRADELAAVTDFARALQQSGAFEQHVDISTVTTDLSGPAPVLSFALKVRIAAPKPEVS